MAMIALVAFCGVVVGFVAEPDLAITTVLVLLLASHDFWITVFKKKDAAAKRQRGAALESRPTGVSGKPADAGAAETARDEDKKPASGKTRRK